MNKSVVYSFAFWIGWISCVISMYLFAKAGKIDHQDYRQMRAFPAVKETEKEVDVLEADYAEAGQQAGDGSQRV